MILDPASVSRDVTLAADACIVGSGAGGATVGRELARAGRSVVIVEEGPYLRPQDFSQREDEMFPRMYAEHGISVTPDSAVMVALGRVVGGSTVPGLCVCARPPGPVLDEWARASGLESLRATELEGDLRRVEQQAAVSVVSEADVNANNARIRQGATRLGWHWRMLAHNRIRCLGCGFCALGCAYDRKADALTVHLRGALAHGALIVPQCRVDRVLVEHGAAAGVTGRFLAGRAETPFTLTVRAPVVVLAAGALGSPLVWLRSQLPDRGRQVGRHLRLHPQAVVAAVFPEEIRLWEGIPQSVVVDEFLDPEPGPGAGGGYWISGFTAHPVLAAALLPGIGTAHRGLMGAYRRLGLASVTLNERSAGRVTLDGNGQGIVTYQLGDDDRHDLLDGVRRAAEIYLAAHAERVLLPFNDLVEMTRRGDHRGLDGSAFRTSDPLLLAFAPQGTLRMGADPARSVVGADGAAHDVRGLYVADASVFPASSAAPPLLTVMALALRTAARILASEPAGRRRRTAAG